MLASSGDVETSMLRALPTATLLELKEEFARETSLQISRKDLCLHNGLGQVGGTNLKFRPWSQLIWKHFSLPR